MNQYSINLKNKRKALGIRLRELSDATGIAMSNINMYENGRKNLIERRWDLLNSAMDKIILLKISELQNFAEKK